MSFLAKLLSKFTLVTENTNQNFINTCPVNFCHLRLFIVTANPFDTTLLIFQRKTFS